MDGHSMEGLWLEIENSRDSHGENFFMTLIALQISENV